VVLSTFALLATGVKAATWTWFGYKTIDVACKLGKSLTVGSRKGQKQPKFKSGRVDKFYKKSSRPRNKEKLAQRMAETIREGEHIILIPSLHVSKILEPKVIEEEILEEKIISSMVMKNFSSCNNDCNCSKDGSHEIPAKPEEENENFSAAMIAENTVKELQTMWEQSPTQPEEENEKFSAAMIAENTVKELQNMWEQSPEDCSNESDIVLETPAKYTRVKTGSIRNIFEESVIVNKNLDADFETLRNSTPATFPGKKCDFELSFKIPHNLKLQSSKTRMKARLHVSQLLEESNKSFDSECETQLGELPEESEVNSNEGICGNDSSTFPNVSSSAHSPILRKPCGYNFKRKQRVTEEDFNDIVYREMVTSAKRKLSVDMVNILDVYENSNAVVDLLKDGGSVAYSEVSLLLTPKVAGLVTLNETQIQDSNEVADYRDPLRVWTPTDKSVIPPWNKDLLPSETRPAALDKTPPTPPRIDLSLLACLENFDNEVPKPSAEIILEKDELIDLNAVQDLPDAEEVLVNYDNSSLIRTTPAAIRKASNSEERKEIVDPAFRGENAYEDSTKTAKIDTNMMEKGVDTTLEKAMDPNTILDSNGAHINLTADNEVNVTNKELLASPNRTETYSLTNDGRLSWEVSYDLLNAVSTQDDCRTDGLQEDITTESFNKVFDETTVVCESMENDTFYDIAKQVGDIEVTIEPDDGVDERSNSLVIDGDDIIQINDDTSYVNDEDNSHVSDVNYEKLPCDLEEDDFSQVNDEETSHVSDVNYEEVPCDLEEDEVVLVSLNGDTSFLNHTMTLASNKRSKEDINRGSKGNLAAKLCDKDDEVIVISDDDHHHQAEDSEESWTHIEDEPMESVSIVEDEPMESVSIVEDEPVESVWTAASNLERSIVTDLQLQINGQFEVEELDE